jgi:hypothetical protein
VLEILGKNKKFPILSSILAIFLMIFRLLSLAKIQRNSMWIAIFRKNIFSIFSQKLYFLAFGNM